MSNEIMLHNPENEKNLVKTAVFTKFSALYVPVKRMITVKIKVEIILIINNNTVRKYKI